MNIAQMIQHQNKTLLTSKLCCSKIVYFSRRKVKFKEVLGD